MRALSDVLMEAYGRVSTRLLNGFCESLPHSEARANMLNVNEVCEVECYVHNFMIF